MSTDPNTPYSVSELSSLATDEAAMLVGQTVARVDASEFGLTLTFASGAVLEVRGHTYGVAPSMSSSLKSLRHREMASIVDGGKDMVDIEQLQDFVCAHGFGEATTEGVELGKELMAGGDDVATAAAEIVARGFTVTAE